MSQPTTSFDHLENETLFGIDFANLSIPEKVCEELRKDHEKSQELLHYVLDNDAEELISIEKDDQAHGRSRY